MGGLSHLFDAVEMTWICRWHCHGERMAIPLAEDFYG